MKICSKCKKEKDLALFNKKGKDKHQTYCRECDNKKARDNYSKNREKIKKQVSDARQKRIKLNKQYVRDLKNNTPCKDCLQQYPYYVMDFDHIRDKRFLISKELQSGSLAKIKEEIEKCEIVCSNCHRHRTYMRSINKKKNKES